MDGSPGFSAAALRMLKRKVAELEETSRKLFVSISCDDMSIRKIFYVKISLPTCVLRKGQCHKIFDIFFMNHPIWAQDKPAIPVLLSIPLRKDIQILSSKKLTLRNSIHELKNNKNLVTLPL